MKPIIGITTNYSMDDTIGTKHHIGGLGQHWNLLAQDYIDAVERAGGIPLMIPMYQKRETLKGLIGVLDGILFSGGSDINPLKYGECVEGHCGTLCTKRDEQEIELLKDVLEKTELPVLGICRGNQLLNVAMGGALHQDMKASGLKDHMLLNARMDEVSHRVRVKMQRDTFDLFTSTTLMTNSFHHQAIKTLGEGLEVVAESEDGIIEAVIMNKRPAFTYAIQWHPEALSTHYPDHQRIFDIFVDQASKYKKKESV